MDLKRLTEWLATAEGFVKSALAFFGLPALVWAAAAKVLDPLALPRWVTVVASVVVTALLAWLLWRSYRRFAVASRLEEFDAFTLRPTSPSSLIGRGDDLDKLLRSVRQYRVVLLDGESGCGKSALVFAGLIPELEQQPDGLLPVAIRDWGEDWVRGPLSAALEALFDSLSASHREKLGWTTAPDLAAETSDLARDLEYRLKSVFETSGRRPLLVADQFDDHQAQHRRHFIDAEANWLAPSVLAASNPFWGVISRSLNERRLHLLVVTRADTAAGLACVRFLPSDQTAARTLPRIEVEYVRPLLANIAPDSAKPQVVSHPDCGWHDLRECLETDLQAEGAVLMQQVRIVLLGLRQLSLLTPARYRAAGGLHGVETLFISRALKRAASAAGGGDAGLRDARAVLNELILPGGPNQAPKAQRAGITALARVTGDLERAQAIVAVLQREELVRPAEAVGDASAWQLDHDYLARAVLAEAGQSARWAVVLREGRQRYAQAAGSWRRQWAALLPFRVLVRICWERARKRLEFGDAAGYARASALKPALVVAALVLGGVGLRTSYGYLIDFGQAYRISADFDTRFEPRAVLDVWSAPEFVRQRVYRTVLPNAESASASAPADTEFQNILFSGWPIAHAGLESSRAREAAAALRNRLLIERDPRAATRLTTLYYMSVARLGRADLEAETSLVRDRLAHDGDGANATGLVEAYAALASLVGDAAKAREAAALLRRHLTQDQVGDTSQFALSAYEEVATLLGAADARVECEALRAALLKEPDDDSAGLLGRAYAAAAARCVDKEGLVPVAAALRQHLDHRPYTDFKMDLDAAYRAVSARLESADAKTEAQRLEALLLAEKQQSTPYRIVVGKFAPPYAALIARAGTPADALASARLLRALMDEGAPVSGLVAPAAAASAPRQYLGAGVPSMLVDAYATVAARLGPEDLKSEAALLRKHIEAATGDDGFDWIESYSAVARRFGDVADVNAAAQFMLTQQLSRDDLLPGPSMTEAYAALSARMGIAEAAAQAAQMRAWLDKEQQHADHELVTATVAEEYAAAQSRVDDPAAMRGAAAFLRERLEQALKDRFSPNGASHSRAQANYGNTDSLSESYARAYGVVAARLGAADARAEAKLLRAHLLDEQDGRIACVLAQGYVAAAIRLDDTAELKTAADILDKAIQRESYIDLPDRLANDYVQVATVLVARADAVERPALARTILVLASHPYLEENRSLLALLKPWSNKDFGPRLGEAVAWAEATYGLRASELRPAQR